MGAGSAVMEVTTKGVSWSGRVPMSKADQFRRYAEEAMDWGRRAKTEKEKQAYIDLARTWTQAAMQSERILVFNSSPPEARAP